MRVNTVLKLFLLFWKKGRNEPIWRDLILEEKGGNQAFTSFISNPTNGHLIRPCADVSGSAQISGVSAEIGDVKAESLNTAEYHYLGNWTREILCTYMLNVRRHGEQPSTDAFAVCFPLFTDKIM